MDFLLLGLLEYQFDRSFRFAGEWRKFPGEAARCAPNEQRGQLGVNLLNCQMGGNANHAFILLSSHKRQKVLLIEGYQYPLFRNSQAVHSRISQSCQVEIITDMLNIKPAVEARKARAGAHILIEQEFVFVKSLWHAARY